MAIQGFGNVGLHTALFLYEHGLKIVAVSDIGTALYNPEGFNVPELISYYNANERSLAGYGNATVIPHEAVLTLNADVLIPAAKEDVITAQNAADIKANIIIEAANGPVASEADAILNSKGIVIVPDIIANAGGVTVSYFEWLQNSQLEKWDVDTVNQKLEALLNISFEKLFETANHYKIPLRTAAYVIALKKVADTIVAKQNIPGNILAN